MRRENNFSYDLSKGTSSLTTWVATERRSIRLHDLHNKRALDSEFAAYSPKPKWSNLLQDSESHSSFLAVPLINSQNQLVGVLRFTEKKDADKFTYDDECLLAFVGKMIADRLGLLLDSDMSTRLGLYLETVTDMGLIDAEGMDLAKTILDGIKVLFPEKNNGNKLYLINTLDEDGQHFTQRELGGSLEFKPSYKSFPLKGSLTGEAVIKAESLFVEDIENAKEMKLFHRVNNVSICAIACRIKLGTRVCAVVVIESELFDIHSIDSKAIEMLGRRAAELYARRDLVTFLSAPEALRHDIRGILGELRSDFVQIFHDSETKSLIDFSESESLIDFLEFIYGAYCRSAPLEPSDVLVHCSNVRVESLISTAVVAAKRSLTQACPVEINVQHNLEVKTYPDSLVAIVFNLTKNAIKAAEAAQKNKGKVRVSAVCDDDWLEITVHDNGHGITDSVTKNILQEDFHPIGNDAALRMGAYEVKRRGVFLSKALATWHALSQGGSTRSGQLKLKETSLSGTKIVCRLPIVLSRHDGRLK